MVTDHRGLSAARGADGALRWPPSVGAAPPVSPLSRRTGWRVGRPAWRVERPAWRTRGAGGRAGGPTVAVAAGGDGGRGDGGPHQQRHHAGRLGGGGQGEGVGQSGCLGGRGARVLTPAAALSPPVCQPPGVWPPTRHSRSRLNRKAGAQTDTRAGTAGGGRWGGGGRGRERESGSLQGTAAIVGGGTFLHHRGAGSTDRRRRCLPHAPRRQASPAVAEWRVGCPAGSYQRALGSAAGPGRGPRAARQRAQGVRRPAPALALGRYPPSPFIPFPCGEGSRGGLPTT